MKKSKGESEFYFRIHLLLVVVGVLWYLTAVSWLVWRIVVGGPFELALGAVVITVLLTIMLTACGSALVIVLEGHSADAEVKPLQAQNRLVSPKSWTIQNPLQRHDAP